MAGHPHKGHAVRSVISAVLTVSDTRTPADDASGRSIMDGLAAAGHVVRAYEIVPDEPREIRDRLRIVLADALVQAVIATGGTGIAPRDGTTEVVQDFLEKEIRGFGELFRSLSYADIGPAAMLSRATAGVASGKVLIALPGSTRAVELAMTKLILPEIGHMVFLAAGNDSR